MKKKVLHIITRLDHGGSATNTLETVKRLNKEKYETTLISGQTADPSQDIQKEISENGIQCTFIPQLRRPIHAWYDMIAFLKLKNYLKTNHFDIVHTHSSKGGLLGRWAAKCAGVPIIVHTPHGHIFYGYFNALLTKLFIWLERQTAKVTDRIITLTDIGQKDHIHFRIAAQEKFKTIYSGIDLNQFQASPETKTRIRKSLQIPPDHWVIGSVTRLEPIKGNDILLEAFQFLLKKHPRTILLLVGEGTQKDYLEKKSEKLHIREKIIFAGYRKNVSDMINAMDIFILASLNEGMGRAILEAMACQKPVVASQTGGIPEIITDQQNGLLVPPGDKEKLFRAIDDLLRHPQLITQMGQAGYKQVTEKYSLEKMVTDIDQLYTKLLNSKV